MNWSDNEKRNISHVFNFISKGVNSMPEMREKILIMLNNSLELEHAAKIQYLTHAEMIKGPDAEKIIERLKEIASDEEKHEGLFRNLIGAFWGGVPSMGMAQTHSAENREAIFKVNRKDEKTAIDYYKQIYREVCDNKSEFQYEFETLEHNLRHIILDEQEHVAELNLLLGD
jgi:bacterioferritin (cytochrome b1)